MIAVIGNLDLILRGILYSTVLKFFNFSCFKILLIKNVLDKTSIRFLHAFRR